MNLVKTIKLKTGKIEVKIRDALATEAKYLSDLSARSKAYWPYDKEYLTQAAQVTHVTENDILSWHFRVAVYDGKILGFSGMAPVKNEYMLDHLWIEPEYIDKGIGQVLFEDAVLSAKRMGWTRFTIASDPYAEKFYLKQGAKRIGERESKIKPGFFLPLLEVNVGLTLIGDKKIKEIPVHDCGESIVDLSKSFPQLHFDWDRLYVQKKSSSISLGRHSIGEKLVQAQNLLPKGYRLLIKECHRPMLVQKEFWDGYFSYLKSKFPTWADQEIYDECSKLNAPLEVAPHTTGGAVDLTLNDESGNAHDLGTKFNAEPLETENATFTIATNISDEARKNRQLLMSVMSKAGFVNYPTEWWHWSYGDKYWAFQTRQPFAIYDSINSEINTLKSKETL